VNESEWSRIARTIVWDYRYRPEDVADVLRGRRERIGHFDRPALFTRMLQTMPWQRIVMALTFD